MKASKFRTLFPTSKTKTQSLSTSTYGRKLIFFLIQIKLMVVLIQEGAGMMELTPVGTTQGTQQILEEVILTAPMMIKKNSRILQTREVRLSKLPQKAQLELCMTTSHLQQSTRPCMFPMTTQLKIMQ